MTALLADQAMRTAQAADVDRPLILAAARDAGTVVIYDNGEPVARIVPVSAGLADQHQFFVHYPHDVSECLHSCWRHPRPEAQPAARRPGRPSSREHVNPAQ